MSSLSPVKRLTEWATFIVACVTILGAIITTAGCFFTLDKTDAVFAQKIETLFNLQVENKTNLALVNEKMDIVRVQLAKIQARLNIRE